MELETEDYDYVPEYKEIPISDNPEDTEVAEAVINAVNNVMEFPDKDNDIHLYIDYNGSALCGIYAGCFGSVFKDQKCSVRTDYNDEFWQ